MTQQIQYDTMIFDAYQNELLIETLCIEPFDL